jgi:hypothetical protein
MDKVRFEISGSLGILTLTNPPLNLFSGELIEDLRASVDHVQQPPLRALLVRAEGSIILHCPLYIREWIAREQQIQRTHGITESKDD